jgi:16S rRNA (adenine1518-N6/adenine1519-N6)-dimethyltransferase
MLIHPSRSYPAANKNLGQHFLVNEVIQNRIIEACRIKPEDTVLEIGSGLGALTGHLVEHARHVFAVETDPRMIDALKDRFACAISLQDEGPQANQKTGLAASGRLTIVPADILYWDMSRLTAPVKVVGNLPYNISTPIMERLIRYRNIFRECFLTLQWEFGQRIAADCHTKSYGAFSCFVQYYADVKILFKIRNTAFRPVPKVLSCFCHLRFRNPTLAAINEDFLFTIIRQAFQQRRKKITNALASKIDAETLTRILTELKLSADSRAENISWKDYVRISNSLQQGF